MWAGRDRQRSLGHGAAGGQLRAAQRGGSKGHGARGAATAPEEPATAHEEPTAAHEARHRARVDAVQDPQRRLGTPRDPFGVSG
jgi:hypothetical protein